MRTALVCALLGAAVVVPGCRRHNRVVIEDRRPETVVVQQPVREREVVVRQQPAVEREVIVERPVQERRTIVVERPIDPPSPRVEVRTQAPGPDHVYLEGYYDFNGSDWVWVPGRWERPARSDARWVPGRWVKVAGGYTWEPGHWEQ
jgi:hypothetical protein